MQSRIEKQSWLNRRIKSSLILRKTIARCHELISLIPFFLKFRWKSARTLNVLYLFFDPSKRHPGLADRIKAIVNAYYIAQKNAYAFKIIFKQPFDLRSYLQPCFISWDSSPEDLEFSIFDTRFFSLQGRMVKLKPNKHYICVNYNSSAIPQISGNDSLWRELFSQLFAFSPKLEKLFLETGLKQREFVAVHLRFLNALGMFEKGCPPLRKEQQESLIKRCRDAIHRICQENKGLKIAVFSDSSFFLDQIEDLPVISMSGNISHISYSRSEEEVQKAFLDLLTISKASKVIRISSSEMYKSEFPIIAARIGSVDVYDVIV